MYTEYTPKITKIVWVIRRQVCFLAFSMFYSQVFNDVFIKQYTGIYAVKLLILFCCRILQDGD